MRQNQLDVTDLAILSKLQSHGRMKNVELAEMVALSPSPCLQRVKRLEKLGFIKAYQAEISLEQILDTVQVLTHFNLKDDTAESHHKFQQQIPTYQEVLHCFMGSGGFDYQVHFMCRSISHYQDVIRSVLDKDMAIEKYHSYVVMKEIVSRSQVPLKILLPSINN